MRQTRQSGEAPGRGTRYERYYRFVYEKNHFRGGDGVVVMPRENICALCMYVGRSTPDALVSCCSDELTTYSTGHAAGDIQPRSHVSIVAKSTSVPAQNRDLQTRSQLVLFITIVVTCLASPSTKVACWRNSAPTASIPQGCVLSYLFLTHCNHIRRVAK